MTNRLEGRQKDNQSELILMITTCPDQASTTRIIQTLLQKKLAACIQETPITSHYVWQGQQEKSTEIKLEIKTIADLFETINECIQGLHPYDCPEVIALPITQTSTNYAEWLVSNVDKA